MTLYRTEFSQYHPLQGILRLPVFFQFKMQVVAGCCAGMPDIADMPAHADIVPFFHVQFTQVRIQRGKATRMPDFDVPAVTATVPGFNDLPTSRGMDRRAIRCGNIHSGMENPSLFHRMHPHSETGRNGKPPTALVQGEYNRIISQHGYRQPAVSYERLSLPGGMDTIND